MKMVVYTNPSGAAETAKNSLDLLVQRAALEPPDPPPPRPLHVYSQTIAKFLKSGFRAMILAFKSELRTEREPKELRRHWSEFTQQ